MLAAIPYFALGVYNLQVPGLGSLPIDPWATLVAIGFVVALELARHRGLRMGIDPRDVVDGAVFIAVSAFFMAHVVTVLAYHPERLAEDGIWSLLKVWEGFSSYGGFLGAILATVIFFRWIRPRPFWRFADLIAFGFPFGWLFGRMGCSVVHDHVGKKTDFFLAMDFDHGLFGAGDPAPWADGVRHELGMYEAMFMVPVAAAFWLLGRKDRPPGFFAGLFAVVYAPVRFGLDELRNTDLAWADARYYGLTPGQYGSLLLFLAGAAVLATRDWRGFRPWALDGSPEQGEPRGAEE
ncbi:MAG: prolipoprotein diacylglyceryl transferase [Deltaproteobacteria bacterium]|nr:prolipoprotein diacylglyceryl transferase [Deltaproteobacteria bacterium]